MDEPPTVPTREHQPDGEPHAALANAVVSITKEYVGRGPTQARAYMRDDLVAVVLGDTLTKAEQTLAADGKTDRVLALRRDFQHAMRHDLVAAVERITGRAVIAFMSDNHIGPDLACEVFLLGPQPEQDAG